MTVVSSTKVITSLRSVVEKRGHRVQVTAADSVEVVLVVFRVVVERLVVEGEDLGEVVKGRAAAVVVGRESVTRRVLAGVSVVVGSVVRGVAGTNGGEGDCGGSGDGGGDSLTGDNISGGGCCRGVTVEEAERTKGRMWICLVLWLAAYLTQLVLILTSVYLLLELWLL